MIPAYLYYRVSTNQQDMMRQEHALREYCQRVGLQAIGIYPDPDTSSSIPMMERPEAAKMFADLEAGRGIVAGKIAVVTSDQDRIGRDILDIVGSIRRLWELGASVHFAMEGGELTRTPENELLMGIKASTAQFERDKLRQRIVGKLTAKRHAGELTGTVPYGWDAEETGAVTAKGVKVRRLVDNPEEQRWILRMVQLRETDWGYHSIAKELNRLKVPTKRGKGVLMKTRAPGATDGKANVADTFTSGKWQCGNVARVLSNDTVKAWLLLKSLRVAA